VLKRDKERVVNELVERLRSSDTLIVADYRGLSVTEIDDVRTKLLAQGARFSVVKNRLTKRAAEEAGVPALTEFLEGPSAIAFVGDGDMVGVAKALNESAKRTKVLSIKGGILQGAPMEAAQVVELASLPSADVLQGQVLGAIVGPLTSIVGLIDARVDQLGDADAAPVEEKAAEQAAETSEETTAETTEETTEEA